MPPVLPLRREVDVIGVLYAERVLPEGWSLGDPLPATEALPAWHVNVTPLVLAERPALEAHVVSPATLRRVWAGDDPANPSDTVALSFANEAQARAALGNAWPRAPA